MKPSSISLDTALSLSDEEKTKRICLAQVIEDCPEPEMVSAILAAAHKAGTLTVEDACYLSQLYGRTGKHAVIKTLQSGIKASLHKTTRPSRPRGRTKPFRGSH
eukprot:Blabericola_migrator_1__5460@NODE_2790_length_2349_cov_2740_468011_g1749_i0_p4_GENE_NODE_2790_length_2349_cov_2740_468011_g1749_i0NODE_2790_length_2349_cov_2740_468011_g1749_i0_p4_ORF_typecomplete_len104_score12_63YycC/PF14174_6/0_093_NODE_2790_length_2349_cov_2740_468011_g1749_i018432154